MRAADEWSTLQNALSAASPACAGDDRFIRDGTARAEAFKLAPLCRSCPVLAECAAYAGKVGPYRLAGFWAGRWRGAAHPDDEPQEPPQRSAALTAAQVAHIAQLRSDGLSLAAIAGQLGISQTTVARRLRQLAHTATVCASVNDGLRTASIDASTVSSFALCRGFRCVPCRVRWCR